MTVIVTLDHE